MVALRKKYVFEFNTAAQTKTHHPKRLKQATPRAPTPPTWIETEPTQNLKLERKNKQRLVAAANLSGRSPTMRKQNSLNGGYKRVSMSGNVDTTSNVAGDDFFGCNDQNKDDDDNMSLISMTRLVADDVCQLDNCRYENIGPDIRPQLEIKVVDFKNRNIKPKSTSPRSKHGYGTPETRSMNSGSQSPEGNRIGTKPSSSRMEVQELDESDNISDITPTGCAGWDTHRHRENRELQASGRRKKSTRGEKSSIATKSTSSDPSPGCCDDDISPKRPQQNRSKDVSSEEPFREFIESISACLPTSNDFQQIHQSLSTHAQSKFDGLDKSGILSIHKNENGGESACNTQPQLCERNRSFDGVGSNLSFDEANSLISSRSFDTLRSYNSLYGGSIVSAPATPFFKDNTDRYNQLVIGLAPDRDLSESQKHHRKFSRAWFKSKREIEQRQRNTKIIPQQDGTLGKKNVATSKSKRRSSKSFATHETTNFEVIWKPSSSKLPRGLSTPDSKQPQSKFKKMLLGRRKSKKEVKPELKQVRAVAITATDTRRWKTKETCQIPSNSCKDGGIDGVRACVPICADTTKTIATAATATAIAATAAVIEAATADIENTTRTNPRVQKSTKAKAQSRDSKARVRTIASTSNKNHGPIWRGTPDSDFQPNWHGIKESQKKGSKALPPNENIKSKSCSRNPLPVTRKNHRNRCYHRNSEVINMADDNSGPVMKWNRNFSYDTDDCRQQDVKVLSIVGPHISSSKRDSQPIGKIITACSKREPQPIGKIITAKQVPTKKQYDHPQHITTKLSNQSSSSSTSSGSSSLTPSCSTSSSSSRPQRTSASRRRKNSSPDMHYLNSRSAKRSDIASLRQLTDKEMHSQFVDYDDDDSSSENIKSPWRNDFRAYSLAKKAESTTSHTPDLLAPPRIQRHRSAQAYLEGPRVRSSRRRTTKQNATGIPRQPRMLV